MQLFNFPWHPIYRDIYCKDLKLIIMNQFVRNLSSAACIAVSLCLFSCDNDTVGFGLSGKDGCPSVIETDNRAFYLSYDGYKISEIKEKDGSGTSFSYEQNKLKSISFTPPKDVMDGHGSVDFRQEGNKIWVESSGEPFFELYVTKIELDENQLPVKITEMGQYHNNGSEGLVKEHEGERYTSLTYDASTRNLLKKEVFSIKESKLLRTYTYKYDNMPGSMSQTDLPAWFFIYWSNRYTYDFYHLQYSNYKNNVIETTLSDDTDGSDRTTTYEYTYNDNKYPVSSQSNGEEVKIAY